MTEAWETIKQHPKVMVTIIHSFGALRSLEKNRLKSILQFDFKLLQELQSQSRPLSTGP